MSLIMAYSASCGAQVKFHDLSYIGAGESELALRHENLTKTAQQIALKNDLQRIREKQPNSPENA